MHAADVAQAMYCYLLEEKVSFRLGLNFERNKASNVPITFLFFQLKSVLSPFDFFFSVMAAICHDLDHPGVNQSYLEKTKHYLASLYEV